MDPNSLKSIFDMANQITSSMSSTDKEKLLNMDMGPIAQALQSMDLGSVLQNDAKDVIKPCPLELADVYTGRQLNVTIKRKRLLTTGPKFEKATLKLCVPAGAADGTVFRFPKAGDEVKPGVFSDLVVMLKIEPDKHEAAPLLNIEGQNLVWELDVPLWELYAMDRQLTLFAHKPAATFTVPLQWSSTSPVTEHVVRGRGLPPPGPSVILSDGSQPMPEPGPRGDLIIRLRPVPPTFRSAADVPAFHAFLQERCVATTTAAPEDDLSQAGGAADDTTMST